jgi:hypothetical protein
MHRRKLALTFLALSGVAVMLALAFGNRSAWSVDFNQYYAAGSLAGTGHLYDWPAIQARELEHGARAVPFGRLPAFALAMKPFSALPYSIARGLFLALELAALAGFVWLWPFPRRAWAVAAICWSAPVAMCLGFGQDSVLFLFFVAAGLRLLLNGNDFSAGLVFSLCAGKPHLALLLPVALAATRRYTALLGGIAGGAMLVALSFAAEGSQWLNQLLALTHLPDFDPAPDRMPNMRGLLSFFGGSLSVEIVVAVVTIAAVWFLSRRLPLNRAFALTLAGGLMLSHHSYSYDSVLLIPALLIPFDEASPEWLRIWAFVLLTPIPYLLLLTNAELPAHLSITGYTIALLATIRGAASAPGQPAAVSIGPDRESRRSGASTAGS